MLAYFPTGQDQPGPTPSPAPGVGRLDAAAVRAIDATCAPDGTAQLREYHGIDVWSASCETLAYSPKQAASRFGSANTQKLAAALLTYQDRFAPDSHWRLIGCQPEHGSLTWRCRTLDLPVVIDVITRTRHLALVGDLGGRGRDSYLRDHHDRHPGTRAGVIRWLDMSDPSNSHLTFPEGTFAWAVVDDPIRMRELGFATTAADEQVQETVR